MSEKRSYDDKSIEFETKSIIDDIVSRIKGKENIQASFRAPRYVIQSLTSIAKGNGISFNSLVANILIVALEDYETDQDSSAIENIISGE